MQVTRNGLPVSIYPAFEAEAGKKKKKHFSELIRTYTIRDYSFNPQTMLAYGVAMQSWPGSDSIHIKHSTHLAMLRRAQTIAQMRVHPLK